MTIEQNLARYRELGKEIDKVRAEHPASMVNHKYDTIKFVELKSNSLPTRSILRDLETAVDVIKVLREGLESTAKIIPYGNAGKALVVYPNEIIPKSLAIAAEKMGEPTSRSE